MVLHESAEQELVSLGFSYESAVYLCLAFDLASPISENIKNNIRLLKKSMDLDSLEEKQFAQVGFFLLRDLAENYFMASVPERYAFSEEQKDTYNHNLLNWNISYDLSENLDDYLKRVVSNEQKRQNIYREMYLNGAWDDIGVLKEICIQLSMLPTSPCTTETFVCKWWPVLFSSYSGTLACFGELKKLFKAKHILTILDKDIEIIRTFTDSFSPFTSKEEELIKLKEKYECYLND